MANSILGNTTNNNGNLIGQLQNFAAQIKGNPQQMVMQMVQQGRISEAQLQQAMQQARQICNFIK